MVVPIRHIMTAGYAVSANPSKAISNRLACLPNPIGATTDVAETLRKRRHAPLLTIQESRPPAFADDVLRAACGGAPAPHYPRSSLPGFSRPIVCICSFVIPWDISPPTDWWRASFHRRPDPKRTPTPRELVMH